MLYFVILYGIIYVRPVIIYIHLSIYIYMYIMAFCNGFRWHFAMDFGGTLQHTFSLVMVFSEGLPPFRWISTGHLGGICYDLFRFRELWCAVRRALASSAQLRTAKPLFGAHIDTYI